MPSRRRFANLAVVAALATLTAACSPEDLVAFGTENFVAPRSRVVDVVPRVRFEVSGSVLLQYDETPPSLTVDFHFTGAERKNVGALYPVHVHEGLNCGGVNVLVAHDLGAPASSIRAGDGGYPSVWIYSAPIPILHMTTGYYLDVHAPNDPTGLPLACADF
jgi:hypothetical protein